MKKTSALHALAERYGILAAYRPAEKNHLKHISDATRKQLLRVLGVDVSNTDALRQQLATTPATTTRRAHAQRGALEKSPRCVAYRERLGRHRSFGLWANLYSLRSSAGLGIGNLSDLGSLVDFAAEVGAQFIGVNPLHLLRNRFPDVSPYNPVSRLFRNPLYLDPRTVPEFQDNPEAKQLWEQQVRGREALCAAEHIDYDRVRALQQPLLETLHAAFRERHVERETARGRAFRQFQRRGGDLLQQLGNFLALEDELAGRGFPRDWHTWPAQFRRPDSPAVRRFGATHAEATEFHVYAQFEIDRQLARVAARAQRAGLAIGLYQDLALGSSTAGFDAWAFPDLVLDGVTVGAPPDPYNLAGQDWGFPPLHPQRLLEKEGLVYWERLLDNAFAHAGALRIDHILGLVRLWWIPQGARPTDGAYLRYPTTALLAALAAASRRHNALVIGEDLGTVPAGLQAELARWNILSSRVLLFERDRRGSFRNAAHYSRRALVTATTHDFPPLLGYFAGRDLELRRELGIIRDDAALKRQQNQRARERAALLRRLAREGMLRDSKSYRENQKNFSNADLCAALHRFLCRTPAPLVGLSLDDLCGETEPVNLPGVPLEKYPSWTRRMRFPLRELMTNSTVQRSLEGTVSRR